MFTKERVVVILLVAVILVAASFYNFWQKHAATEHTLAQVEEVQGTTKQRKTANSEDDKQTETYVIYISGSVNQPGVFQVPANSRVVDVVKAAGGLTSAADQIKINLAEKVRDGMHIHVLDKSNVPVYGDGAAVGSGSDGTGKININSAGKEELDKLPGIGPAMAERIIEYREATGMFKEATDLKKVPGIGEAKFNRLSDKITI